MGVHVFSGPADWQSGKLTRILETIAEGHAEFQAIRVFHAGVPFTLMPAHLANDDTAKSALSVSFGDSGSDTCLSRLSNGKLAMAWAAQPSWKEEVNRIFPSAVLELFALSMAENRGSSVAGSHEISAFVSTGFVEIQLHSKKDGLLLANVFESESVEDVLYYLSHICARHNVEPQHINLSLFGGISPGDMLHSACSRYFTLTDDTGIEKEYEVPDSFPILSVRPHLFADPCAS